MKFNRIFLIVCDSMGIGNAKDAKNIMILEQIPLVIFVQYVMV